MIYICNALFLIANILNQQIFRDQSDQEGRHCKTIGIKFSQ